MPVTEEQHKLTERVRAVGNFDLSIIYYVAFAARGQNVCCVVANSRSSEKVLHHLARHGVFVPVRCVFLG